MSESHVDALQQMPIFGAIRSDILQHLLAKTATVTVTKGNYFFHEEEQAESMFLLERGRVAVIKAWKGHNYLLRELEPGACFGEMSLIDLRPRSATVQALEDCAALELTNSALYEICLEDAEQFALVYMNIARELSRRLRAADGRWFQSLVDSTTPTDSPCYTG
jgi:CRP-like cAMP-binding protein